MARRGVCLGFMLGTSLVERGQNFQGEINLAPSLRSQLITAIGVGGSRSHHIHTQTDTHIHTQTDRHTHSHTDRHLHIHTVRAGVPLVLLHPIQSRSPACGTMITHSGWVSPPLLNQSRNPSQTCSEVSLSGESRSGQVHSLHPLKTGFRREGLRRG